MNAGSGSLVWNPKVAEQRALELFHSRSAVKQFAGRADERLLFSDRCRPLRYVLMALGLLLVSIGVWLRAALLVLPGMAAYLKYDQPKHELGWVQSLADFARFLIISISGIFGGLCALAQICVSLGLRQKARAIYGRGSKLLLCTLGGKGGEIAVPIGLVFVFSVLIIKHSGFPDAGSTQTIAHADRRVPPDSSSSATTSITGPKVSEASTAVASLAHEKRGAVELGGSKPAGPIADAPTSDGLVVSWLTAPVRNTNEEPPPFTDLGVIRGDAGVSLAASEIVGGIIEGSSTLPIKDGTTISTAEPKVNEVDTEVASFADEKNKAIEPAATALVAGTTSEFSALSTAGGKMPSAGLPTLVPAVLSPIGRPAPPGMLSVVVGP